MGQLNYTTNQTDNSVRKSIEHAVITVASSNADYTSVKAACDYAATIATSSNYVTIWATGNFTEEPFTVPSYGKLFVVSGVLTASDADNVFITIEGNAEYRSGTIVGPTNSDAVELTGTAPLVKDVVIASAGNTGIVCTNTTRSLLRNVTISNVARGIFMNGGICILTTSSVALASGVAIEIDNNCTAILNAWVALASTVDFKVSDATSSVSMQASQIDIDKIEVISWDNLQLSFNSSKEADRALENAQEVHVGMPEKGRELSGGEGDSYTRGMLVYTEDTSNVFVDVSAAARSASASSFTFPGIAANNAIYVSSDLKDSSAEYLQFYGFKTLVSTVAVYDAGNIKIQYWNDNSGWIDASYMETQSDGKYLPFAKNIFQNIGAYQIRASANTDITVDPNMTWDKNDPPAIGDADRYWARAIIETGITTAPIFEQYKLQTNKTELNADGWLEYFGSARPTGQLPLSVASGKPFEGAMQSQTLYASENIGEGGTNNKFTSTTDKLGLFGFLPFDCDTSTPLELIWSGHPNGTGTYEWTIRWAWLKEGDGITYAEPGTPIANSDSIVISKAVTLNQLAVFNASLDISEMIARRDGAFGDQIWISIQPTTLPANFTLGPSQVTYTKWNEGGHI